MEHKETPAQPQLPLTIVSPVDLGRLTRELEGIDGAMNQLTLKGAEVKVPKTSKLLDDLISLNRADLLQANHRQALLAFLADLKAKAPVLHISFSADPSPMFIDKIMTYLRSEINPSVLLTIGLQPTIGAGCLVRTTNKYFDFTLRENFTKNRDLLMTKLREVEVAPVAEIAPAAPVVAEAVAA